MIYCCGIYHNPLRTVFLLPNGDFKDRKLEILICSKCGTLIAVLTQFNIKTQKYEIYRPSRKKTAKFIKEIQEQKWDEIKVKYGTRERAGFVYGVNREYKNKEIRQYAVNFNGEKKLVKVIPQINTVPDD